MTSPWTGGAAAALPDDTDTATLVGRAWDAAAGGPVVVAIRNGEALDLSATFATMRDVTEHATPADAVAAATGPVSARSTSSSPTPRPTCATRRGRGCCRRSTCTLSRRRV